mmetsp:Transcript_10093/g.24984  ORF Transcript_10093/g.24984 Transcript_10093/m.24984 type:complete len:86 (-) Transcript_10093:2394-2651(-)
MPPDPKHWDGGVTIELPQKSPAPMRCNPELPHGPLVAGGAQYIVDKAPASGLRQSPSSPPSPSAGVALLEVPPAAGAIFRTTGAG